MKLADVATAAGVSKSAVSFAFNQPEKLGPATLKRVHEVARRLGYAPHPAARALSTRRSGSIGLLIAHGLHTAFTNEFTSELIQGLGRLCDEHDLTLLLVPALNGSLEGAIRRASVDGFISLGLNPDDPALETLERIGIPTVQVDSESRPGQPSVNVDDAGGAEAAGRHLLQLGHRRLAILTLPPPRHASEPSPVARRRLAGYRAALASAGGPEPVLIATEATVAAGAEAYRALPEGPASPTAVLAMSDMTAIGFLAAARARGRRVPQELSVVGFDDVPMAAWTSPPLTTVRQPSVEKGRLAAEMLIQALRGKAVASPPPLETRLVVRDSTAPVESRATGSRRTATSVLPATRSRAMISSADSDLEARHGLSWWR